MKRDAEATRKRILEAATTEFSRYGLAGARVDRIAEAANSNKAMIYAYFGSKEGLFDAVGTELIAWHVQDVPLDTYNLPEYAARVFDRYQNHPELMRLVNWDRLERSGERVQPKEIVKSIEGKVSAIRQAQEDGVVSRHFPTPLLLELILALVELRPNTAGPTDEPAHAARRQAIKDAVGRLVSDS